MKFRKIMSVINVLLSSIGSYIASFTAFLGIGIILFFQEEELMLNRNAEQQSLLLSINFLVYALFLIVEFITVFTRSCEGRVKRFIRNVVIYYLVFAINHLYVKTSIESFQSIDVLLWLYVLAGITILKAIVSGIAERLSRVAETPAEAL